MGKALMFSRMALAGDGEESISVVDLDRYLLCTTNPFDRRRLLKCWATADRTYSKFSCLQN